MGELRELVTEGNSAVHDRHMFTFPASKLSRDHCMTFRVNVKSRDYISESGAFE